MTRYNIILELDNFGMHGEMTEEQMIKFLALAMQKATVDQGILANKIDVKVGSAGTSSYTKTGGTPGRKPVNRPKIEAWIREHVTPGESTQGTSGLNGVDREGRPLIESDNRVYPHRLAAPMPDGVGLSLLAIDKVLRELEIEGFLERGFAAGSPFYELIRPLNPEGYVPGREMPRASVQEVDFSNVKEN